MQNNMSVIDALSAYESFIEEAANASPNLNSSEECSKISDVLGQLEPLEKELRCLPVKETASLQELGQKLWNDMTLKRWPKELNELRSFLKLLVTHIYLLGNNYFTSHQIRVQYFTHHPQEAEKCILMCIKTANALSEFSHTEKALSVVTFATTVFKSIPSTTQHGNSRRRRLYLEVLFTRLEVEWTLENKESAVETAASLSRETADHPAYREALLQFIFTKAESPAAVPPASLEALLQLSLTLQEGTKCEGLREASFYGATQLQLAVLKLETGAPDEAVRYATEAARLLDSLEPHLVQLKAACLKGDGEGTMGIFKHITDLNKLTVTELLELSEFLVRTMPSLFGPVVDICKRCVDHHLRDPNPNEDINVLTQFVSFLLSMDGDEAAEEVVRCLDYYEVGPTAHRFSFLALWSTATKETICLETRLLSFYCSFKYSSAASEEEREGILVGLADCTFCLYEKAQDASLIQQTYDYFERFLPERHLLPSAASLLQLQLVLSAPSDYAALISPFVLKYCKESDFAATCGILVNFALRHRNHKLAAALAQRCLEHKSAFSPIELLSLLRANALAFLDKNLVDEAATATVVMEVAIPVLKEQTVGVDRKWWCQYLFFLGSQVEQDAATALSITKEAIYLFQQLVDTTADDENLKLLKNRLQFLLFSEFKLFSCQEPLLAEKDVLSLAQLLRELADGEDADLREVCFLSESEVFLRRYNMGEHDSDAATIFSIANVNKCMTDLNNLQLLADTLRCTATGLHCAKLGGLALDIQMSIIERTVESHGDCAVERNALHVMSLFSNVYEGLSTLEEKSKIVSLLKSYLYNNVRAASGEDTAGSLAAIQTFVEYFAVDAWNTAVKCNATRQRQLASYWKDVAVDFANLLFAENVTKETLYHFHEIMPLL